MEVANAVKTVKAGQIDFRVDKAGILHTTIGKVSFDRTIRENAEAFLSTVMRLNHPHPKVFSKKRVYEQYYGT